ncbi:hypothetical protein EV363DRAFT_1196294 [Boletus edulis]|nr:hypothetical protein EV363DRAFT_1196294 [Boletus edulis]
MGHGYGDLHASEMSVRARFEVASINSGAAILAYRALAPLLHHLWSMYKMCNMSDSPDSASTRYNDLVLWDDWMVVWTPKAHSSTCTSVVCADLPGTQLANSFRLVSSRDLIYVGRVVLLGNATVWPPQYPLDVTIPLQFMYKLASHVEVSPE